ncbi:hypothetical protein OKW21_003289 [Catalinimonas alkaloidigena]|uniref:hypothetical protein n=1 Tax=Catalinimonas alkaloidigena TaxID=1075417 RepID=UPI002406534E|nr:hypothetical protein [Catalinimonas alkaloidigena]MDF9798026.1 hypothetical protein [Catalinimonas alkaloidigena]
MGYLPIILALLGFVFLWAIVNYNSIKVKKVEVELASRQVFQFASLRNTIIKRMANIVHEDDTLQKIVGQVREQLNELTTDTNSTQEKIEAEKKVTQSVNDIPEGYVKNSAYSEAYHQLQLAQNNYQKAASVYHKRLKEYHELLNRYPSKMVAKVSGFKPVSA